MVFGKILIILVVLLLLYLLYEIVGVLKKRAKTYYWSEDDSLRSVGDASFSISNDAYHFHDNNQPPANRFQGSSNVENGLALINLRVDPSADDLGGELFKAGWVDLNGNIYGESGIKLGFITDLKDRPGINGSTRWYELWLKRHSLVYTCPPLQSEGGDSTAAQPRLIGKIEETGRLGSAKPGRFTVTARAGGFLLLYKDRQPKPQSEDAITERTTWKDTALPAAVIFTFIYGLFFLSGTGRMTFPAIGQELGFTAAMLLVYGAVWGLLRQIKIEASLEGKSFDSFLMLIDRNTGVNGLNNWIIILGVGALAVSVFIYGADFVPLQAAILIGAWVNRKYVTKEPWEVCDYDEEDANLPDWSGDEDSGDSSLIPNTTNETVDRTFNWDLDSPYHRLHGELTVRFSPESIASLRSLNPFRVSPGRGFKANITELLNSCKNNRKVHEVLRYIDKSARGKGLGELDRMQFILDFAQKPNIDYELDEKCEEIGCPMEYARYPDETMFDGRGDCDCKAVLGAILFREAGYKTAYLTTSNHAAIAVAFKDRTAADIVSMADQSLVTKDGYMYFFCETTSDGFRIGDLGDTTKAAIEDIIFLN